MAVKDDKWLEKIGERLREARLISGWEKDQLIEATERLGGKPPSKGTINNWENAKTAPPRADYLLTVCRASRVSPTYVLTGEDPFRWEPDKILEPQVSPPSENGTSESDAA